MALLHDHELRDRVEALLADVGPLHTIAAVGFSEEQGARVEACVRALSGAQGWSFVDCRAGAASRGLAEAAGKPVVVVAVKAGELERPVEALIGAVVDRQPSVVLSDKEVVARPAMQSVVLVCEGARPGERLGRPLERIAYWDFVP